MGDRRSVLGMSHRTLAVVQILVMTATLLILGTTTVLGAPEDDADCSTRPSTVPVTHACADLDEKNGSTNLANGPPRDGEVWWTRESDNDLNFRVFTLLDMDEIQLCTRTTSAYTTERCAGGNGTASGGDPSDRVYVATHSGKSTSFTVDLDTSSPSIASGSAAHWQIHVNQGANPNDKSTYAAGTAEAAKTSPTVSTTPNPSSATVGTKLHDSASLAGGSNPTGTLTFNLYAPGDSTCSETPTHTENVTVSGNGNYATDEGFTADEVGTWRWIAIYNGDTNNGSASHACDDEQVTVSKEDPSISTTPNPTSGSVGTTLKDTATLAAGYSPTGTVKFELYDPGQSDCSGTPRHTETVNANGNGDYSTPNGFTADKPGDWRWIASYSGDSNNEDDADACGDEQVSISQATVGITTTPDPASAKVGDLLNDKATLSGGSNPTGTITFKLYDPNQSNCTGDPRHTEAVPVSGNGDYTTPTGFAADKAGTWRWVASYSGDSNNAADADACGDEQVTVSKATPSISTTPNPGAGAQGSSLNDKATVASGYNPGGQVVFNLYDPDQADCTGTPRFTQSVDVAGNGDYTTSGGFVADKPGTWRWVAVYGGDGNNETVSDDCGDEMVLIAPSQNSKQSPSLKTTPNPSSGGMGTVLNDTADLSGGNAPTGSITFNLYDPDQSDCQGTPQATHTVTVNGAGIYTTPQGFAANKAGTWRWVASYNGDDNNNALSGGCDDEKVTITVEQAQVQGTTQSQSSQTARVAGTKVTARELAATGAGEVLRLLVALVLLGSGGGIAVALRTPRADSPRSGSDW